MTKFWNKIRKQIKAKSNEMITKKISDNKKY